MKSNLKNTVYFMLFTIIFILISALLCAVKALPTRTARESVAKEEMITVVIDAGHGGEDGGAVGVNGVFEKDINLAIAMKLGEDLKKNGVNVVYTRTEDILLYDRNVDYKNKKKSLDLAARVKIANETPNCIFVSIHMNSFSQSQYKGLQVYYSKNHPQSYTLASAIQSAVKSELQAQNSRKATEATSRIYVLDRLDCPAVLIECGFLSNHEECRILSTEIYQEQLSKTISEEIKKYVEKNSEIVLTN